MPDGLTGAGASLPGHPGPASAAPAAAAPSLARRDRRTVAGQAAAELSALLAIAQRDVTKLLRDRPLAATQLAAVFPVSQPAISRHLRVLREADLVHVSGDEADRRLRTYHLHSAPLREVDSWVSGLWQRRLDGFAEYVEEVVLV